HEDNMIPFAPLGSRGSEEGNAIGFRTAPRNGIFGEFLGAHFFQESIHCDSRVTISHALRHPEEGNNRIEIPVGPVGIRAVPEG
ncbi:hypothetical protein QP458_11930, partial [Staphylococcus hominis]